MIPSGPYYQPLACPQCHQIDRVQKVSAVVDAGASYQRVSNVLDDQVTYTQTILSQRLSPPAPPTYQSAWGLTLALLIVGDTLILWAGGYLLVHLPDAAAKFAFALSLMLAGTLALLTLYLGSHANARRKAQAASSYAGWQQAYAAWWRLYYCHRCGGVFLPDGHSPLLPTGQMMQLIYNGAAAQPLPLPATQEKPRSINE